MNSSRRNFSGFPLAVGFVLALCLTENGIAQYISSDQNKGTYLNYSGRNYENYSSTQLRRKFYDNFGNFLVDGITIFGLSEEQRPFEDPRDIPISNISKSRFYSSYFSNLVVLNDSYSGLTSRLMIGDAIRTKFTSLTLDKARFNGIRWDAATPKYRATIVSSRVSDPIRFNPEISLTAVSQIARVREWTDYLLGGHFETDLGDVLTLGVTYVNQHQRRSTLDSKTSSLNGVPANTVPRVIFIRIKDETPGDHSGPIVFNVPQIIINGSPHAMVNINNKTPDPTRVDLKSPIQYWVFRNYSILYVAGGGPGTNARDTVSQTQYVHYRDKSSLARVPQFPYQIPSDRIDEDNNLTFGYVIPPGVEKADFSVILANDFRVDAGHDWINNVDDYAVTPFRSHGDSILTDPVPVPTPFRTLVRAAGNVKDASNKQVVTFSYGLVTGMFVYGMNFKLDWQGFKMEGEFVRSVENFKYPVNQSIRNFFLTQDLNIPDNRFQSNGDAFFIRGTKKIGRVTLGAERYRLDPRFTTLFDHYTLDNAFYGPQNNSGLTPQIYYPDYLGFDPPSTSAFISPSAYIPGQAGGAAFALVDDNDDNDRWEDGFYHYNIEPIPDIRNGDVVNYDYRLGTPGRKNPFALGYRQNLNELIGLGDIIRKPDAGIFPGRDKDRDGIPDDDRNSDGIPDYVQDFLTYYTDPPFFQYGDDWNNNGVIDEQENDILPDYPYDPDLNGYHLFGSIEILKNMTLRVGTIRDKAMARGGKNYSDYARWTYSAGTPKFGNIDLFYVYKKVQDNIANNGYQFITALTINSTIPDWVFDPLEYKNSEVNQMYLGTLYTQIPGVRIENNIRYELNHQYPIGLGLRDNFGNFLDPEDQKGGSIEKMGIVNKIDYTYPLFQNRLLLIPQFKVRRQRVVSQGELPNGLHATNVIIHRLELLPIFRIDYRLTDRTDLRLGFQGFKLPGTGRSFMYQLRDVKAPEADEYRATFAVTLSNRSSYGGYNVVVDFGFTQTAREFPNLLTNDVTKKTKEESTIFMTVYAGF